MKRPIWIAGAVLTAAATAFYQTTEAPPPPLARNLPSGALLVIEAKQFSRLLGAWNSSVEKGRWLQSANYEAFEKSNLAQKLTQVRDEYAQAAGIAPDLALVKGIAGQEAALALYDIRGVEFVYITRLPMARVAESALWQMRDRFQPRQSAGLPFYVRNNSGGDRAVAFAFVKDQLLLATREDLMARSLALMAGGGEAAVTGDDWYRAAAQTEGSPGDVRLTLHLESLRQSEAFRSYWVQRNGTQLKPYWTGVVDLFREQAEIRESRRFLTKDELALPGPDERRALAEAWALVSDSAGFARGVAAPVPADAVTLLRDKVLDPQPVADRYRYQAPAYSEAPDAPGSEGDLEKRIDETKLAEPKAGFDPSVLTRLLEGNPPKAALVTQGTRPGAKDSFFQTPASIVLVGSSDWDGAQVRSAIAASVAARWTTSGIGIGWRALANGAYELDGLRPLATAVRGRLLFVASDAAALNSLFSRAATAPASSGATMRARFRHDLEGPRFRDWMYALDTEGPAPSGTEFPGLTLPGRNITPGVIQIQVLIPVVRLRMGGARGGSFFSGNLGSLSETLQTVHVEEIEGETRPGLLLESVRYKMGQ